MAMQSGLSIQSFELIDKMRRLRVKLSPDDIKVSLGVPRVLE